MFEVAHVGKYLVFMYVQGKAMLHKTLFEQDTKQIKRISMSKMNLEVRKWRRPGGKEFV